MGAIHSGVMVSSGWEMLVATGGVEGRWDCPASVVLVVVGVVVVVVVARAFV